MKKQQYSVVVVGLGRIAFQLGFDRLREQPASHTMALLANCRVRITGGCDIDEDKRNVWQQYVSRKEHCAIPVYGNVDEALQMGCADIIVVAVNESSHMEVALAAINARPRLVILEKPVALDSYEGGIIARAADSNHVAVLVNHERRFADDYVMAREYIANSRIGSVQSVTAELDSSLRVYSPQDARTGAYSLIHDGTHLVDIVRFLLGNVRLTNPLLTSMVKDEKDSSVVRALSVHFTADGCPDVLVKINGQSRFFYFGVEVLGTEGRVRVGNGYAQFERREQSRLYTGFYSLAQDKSVHPPRKTRYFANMVQNAVDFLDGNAPIKSTLQDGLDDLCVLETMRSFCQ